MLLVAAKDHKKLKCKYKSSDPSVFTLQYIWFFKTMLVNTKQQNDEETDNFSSTSVTDDLFVHSALPPATKAHSGYQVELQKEVKSTQEQPSCKKKVRHM